MQRADPVTSQAGVDLGTADLTNAMLLVRQPLLCTLNSMYHILGRSVYVSSISSIFTWNTQSAVINITE